jgi:hypothetical protein
MYHLEITAERIDRIDETEWFLFFPDTLLKAEPKAATCGWRSRILAARIRGSNIASRFWSSTGHWQSLATVE